MPSATAEQRNERRRAIAGLLREHAIERQSELVSLLRTQGFAATQSSVSRDLKDMGAIKLKKGYSLPEDEPAGNADSMQEVAEFVREIRAAGANLLVMTTVVGAAQVYRVPPPGWKPVGWNPPVAAKGSRADLTAGEMLRTWQFFLLWAVYFCGTSVGLTAIGEASPQLQEMARSGAFGSR